MKTINWNKIPNNKVVGKNNVWSLVAQSHQHSPMADLDWAEMEGLFCQQTVPAPSAPPVITNSPRLGARDDHRRDNLEITLLDGKKSLNVNIFLKQFRSSHEDIVKLVREVQPDDIGAERLRGLLRLLPELDELEMLLSFDGDRSRLGTAESFLLRLIQVPNYKLRIESMLLKEEFAANMGYLEPSINAMIEAGEELMTHRALQEVLYMVIVAGNFLNSGGYAGNAAGVKLTALQKLTDIRANKPGMNLLHFVALQAQKRNEALLKFPEQLTVLEDATKTSVEQLQNDINALDTKIKKIRQQIELPTTEKEIKTQMSEFLQIAQQEVAALKRDMNDLEDVKRELADFFCEDLSSFKLEECYKIFHSFCCKFRHAVTDNARRALQEEQAAARRRQREEHLAGKRRQMLASQSGGTIDSEASLADTLFGLGQKKSFDKDSKNRKTQNGSVQGSGQSEEEISVTSSPAVSRRRTGSFSGPSGELAPPQNIQREENYSPDVTPNGTLRRRRSRVPSEEDDSSLMDFLRASGQPEVPKDRKSWGSLDRSWARRARGSGRKRPDLLTADFSGDRERPSSPSFPLVNQERDNTRPPVLPSVLTPTDEGEGKPRAWRQKIEAWLLESECEEKITEEQRRRRRPPTNRRSQEVSIDSNDGETRNGAGLLDTLPEGKLADQGQYKRVYSDWKPTIEKTDVVRAMEAIEEAQQPVTNSSPKDKSQWRKSNLNIATSRDEAEINAKRLRRLRSRTQIDIPDESTQTETDRTKETQEHGNSRIYLDSLYKSNAQDEKLTLYLTKPITINQAEITKRESQRPTSLLLPSSKELELSAINESSSLKNLSLGNSNNCDEDNINTVTGLRIRKPEGTVTDRTGSPRASRRELAVAPKMNWANSEKGSLDSSLNNFYHNEPKNPEHYLINQAKQTPRAEKHNSFVQMSNVIKNEGDSENDMEMGDGSKFDRFSPARKTITRRHKKSEQIDSALPKVEQTIIAVKPDKYVRHGADNKPNQYDVNQIILDDDRGRDRRLSTTRSKLESQPAFDEVYTPLIFPTSTSSIKPLDSTRTYNENIPRDYSSKSLSEIIYGENKSASNTDANVKVENLFNTNIPNKSSKFLDENNGNKKELKLDISNSENIKKTSTRDYGLQSKNFIGGNTLEPSRLARTASLRLSKLSENASAKTSKIKASTDTKNNSNTSIPYKSLSLGRSTGKRVSKDIYPDENIEDISNAQLDDQTKNKVIKHGVQNSRTHGQNTVGSRTTSIPSRNQIRYIPPSEGMRSMQYTSPSKMPVERTSSRTSLRSSRSSIASNPPASTHRKNSSAGIKISNSVSSTAPSAKKPIVLHCSPSYKSLNSLSFRKSAPDPNASNKVANRFGFPQSLKSVPPTETKGSTNEAFKKIARSPSDKLLRNNSINTKDNISRSSSGSIAPVTRFAKAKISPSPSLSFMRPTAASTSKETIQAGETSNTGVTPSRIHRLEIKKYSS